MIDIHSPVYRESHVPRAGKPCVVSSVQLAAPVYCGSTSTSVHLPVSQSSTSMGEGVSSNGPLQGSYREGRVPPRPTPHPLINACYLCPMQLTTYECIFFSLIGRVREDATGIYNELYFSVQAFNSIWRLPVVENSLSHTYCVVQGGIMGGRVGGLHPKCRGKHAFLLG